MDNTKIISDLLQNENFVAQLLKTGGSIQKINELFKSYGMNFTDEDIKAIEEISDQLKSGKLKISEDDLENIAGGTLDAETVLKGLGGFVERNYFKATMLALIVTTACCAAPYAKKIGENIGKITENVGEKVKDFKVPVMTPPDNYK